MTQRLVLAFPFSNFAAVIVNSYYAKITHIVVWQLQWRFFFLYFWLFTYSLAAHLPWSPALKSSCGRLCSFSHFRFGGDEVLETRCCTGNISFQHCGRGPGDGCWQQFHELVLLPVWYNHCPQTRRTWEIPSHLQKPWSCVNWTFFNLYKACKKCLTKMRLSVFSWFLKT